MCLERGNEWGFASSLKGYMALFSLQKFQEVKNDVQCIERKLV
jgi:hypothetical protein